MRPTVEQIVDSSLVDLQGVFAAPLFTFFVAKKVCMKKLNTTKRELNAAVLLTHVAHGTNTL